MSLAAAAVTIALVASGSSLAWGVEPDAEPTPLSSTSASPSAEPTIAPDTPEPLEPAAPAEPAPLEQTESAPVELAPADVAPASGASEAPALSAAAEPAAAVPFWWNNERREVTGTPGPAGVVILTGTLADGATGAPIAGFRIAATGDETSSETEVAATTTTADGSFTLEVPAKTSYLQLAFASGETLYVAGWGSLQEVQLGTAYDLGALTLELGARVSGTVTLPASDAGLFGVDVQLVADGEAYGPGDYKLVPGGRVVPFSIVAPAGTYSLRYSDGSAFVEQWWNNAVTRADAGKLTLVAGQSLAGYDATLAFGQNSLSGRVTNPSGAPVANVHVWAAPTGGGPARSYTATTDANGRYAFGNVEAGTYLLQFSPPRGAGLSTYYGGATYDTATPVVIPAGTPTTLTGLDVALRAGATVTGTLPAAAASRITSIVVRSQEGSFGSTYGWATPASDGTFQLTDIPAGTYRLELRAADFTEQWGEAFTIAEGETRAVDLSGYALELGSILVTLELGSADRSGTLQLLDAGTRDVVASIGLYTTELRLTARVGDYLVRYTPFAGGAPIYYGGSTAASASIVTIVANETIPVTISAGTGTISGTVIDARTDEPIGGVSVRLFRANNTGTYSTPAAVATTDDDGEYAFTGLGVNNYAVQVVGDSQLYVNRWFGGSGAADDATAISLDEGGTYSDADVALTLGGGIAGTYADADSSASYVYASLDVTPTDGGDSLWFRGSDLIVGGAFTLRGIPAGEYRIRGTIADQQIAASEPVVVTAGEIVDGVVLALPPAQIVGTVRAAATGAPVSAYVTATWTETTEWGSWTNSRSAYANSSTGFYRLTDIPAGTSVTLKFSRNSSSQNVSSQWWQGASSLEAATPIVIGAEGSAPFVADVTLEPGVRVTGRFIDAVSGQPVAGVSFSGGTSASDGRFTAVFDRIGDTTLTTDADNRYVTSSTALEIPVEGLTDVEIPLQRGYTISGTVTAKNNGAPLSNVWVRVADADEQWSGGYSISTDSEGEFTVPALTPGRYKVQFENYDGLYVAQWYDGVSSFDDAQVIDVIDRNIDDLDARLSLGGTVAGRIVAADGQPLAGATVGVATAPQQGLARAFGDFFALFAGAPTESPLLDIETTTDANGNFVLPPLDAGDYTLYVYTPATGTTWYNGKATRAAADVIHIGTGDRVTLDGDVELLPLAEGETPRTPEQSLSDSFDIVAHPASASVDEGRSIELVAIASGSPVPSVQWQRRDAGSDTWVDIDGATNTRLSVTATLADAGASFRAVFTQGDEVRETDAATLQVVAAPTAPAAPAAPTIGAVTTTTAVLTWTAPADGGRAISGYELALYAAGAETPLRTISLGAVTTATLGLEPGTEYEVTVAAKNAVGTGAASGRATFTTASLTAPAAPTNIVATPASATSITVTWSAVTPTDSAPLSGYTVTVSTGGSRVTEISVGAGVTSTTVSGLTPDTVYAVGVSSFNAIGATLGAVVDVRTAALPPAATVPSAPTALAVIAAEPRGVQFGWQAPASDGGSAITGYTLTLARGAETVRSLTVGAEVRQAAVAGLDPETTYTVSVTATNGVGVSSATTIEVTTTAVPIEVPSAPTQLVGAATSTTSASISWQAPASDGGSPISGYDVIVTRGGEAVAASVVVTGTSAVISGLLPDTGYLVTVAARNAAGAGATTAALALTTPAVAPVATVPDAPGAPQAVAVTTDSVSLTWAAPASDGGAPIIRYSVRVYGGTQEGLGVPADGTTVTVTGLIAATPYLFTVQAINAAGVSAESDPSALITTSAATEPGTPGEPGTPTLPETGGPAPSGAGGAPSASQLTEQNRGGVTTGASQIAAGARLDVSGLTPGMSYEVWFFSSPVAAGTVTADAAGQVRVTVPTSLTPGAHRVVFVDTATGAIAGWAPITVVGLPATGADAPAALAVTAGALLIAGALLLVASRRRCSTTHRA